MYLPISTSMVFFRYFAISPATQLWDAPPQRFMGHVAGMFSVPVLQTDEDGNLDTTVTFFVFDMGILPSLPWEVPINMGIFIHLSIYLFTYL